MLWSLVPARLQSRLRARQRGIVIEINAADPLGSAQLTTYRNGVGRSLGTLGTRPPGALPKPNGPVTIMLAEPGERLLVRLVNLPLAAESNLHNVIGFEMDRLTPFDADAVLWRTEIIRRNRETQTMILRLWVLPRQFLAGLLANLADEGMKAQAVELAHEGKKISLPLQQKNRGQTGNSWWLALSGGLALLCLVIPILRQNIQLHAIEARATALAPQLRKAEILRDQLVASAQDQQDLAGEQRREGNILQALSLITKALPDGSFLTDLSLHNRVAVLDGESQDASGLVAALSADPGFANPAFAAPVTRALNEKADIFAIKVEMSDHAAH